MKKNPYAGPTLEDFKKEVFKSPIARKTYEQARIKRKIREMVKETLKQKHLTFHKLAKKMDTSVSQTQRLLNEENISLKTLVRFAVATGKKLSVELK